MGVIRMTKAEFIERRERFERYSKRFDWIYSAAFMALLIANIPFAKSIPKEYNILYLVLFFGFLFGNLWLIVWLAKSRVKKFGMTCPNCSKPLTQTAGQLLVVTGQCCHCGTTLFDAQQ